jgi:hypothetical protein
MPYRVEWVAGLLGCIRRKMALVQDGPARVDDLCNASWIMLLASLSRRGLGSVEIDGWKRH